MYERKQHAIYGSEGCWRNHRAVKRLLLRTCPRALYQHPIFRWLELYVLTFVRPVFTIRAQLQVLRIYCDGSPQMCRCAGMSRGQHALIGRGIAPMWQGSGRQTRGGLSRMHRRALAGCWMAPDLATGSPQQLSWTDVSFGWLLAAHDPCCSGLHAELASQQSSIADGIRQRLGGREPCRVQMEHQTRAMFMEISNPGLGIV